jgi:hypothetical protein
MWMMQILTILKECLTGMIRVTEEAHFYLIKALIVFKMNIILALELPRVIL